MTKTICFDLDGTLCTNTFGEYESAEPFPWAIDRLNRLARAGHRIIVFTARGTATGIDWKPVTRRQLADWGVRYDELHFGKPSADVYVDDRAVHTTAWRFADISDVPGFSSGDGELPALLPAHLATTTEVGRTFAGEAMHVDLHARRARELGARAGIRPLPSPAVLQAAVAEALARVGGSGEEQVFTISISAVGHGAFVDAVEGAQAHHVSCRPLAHVEAGLEELLASGTGWPLAKDEDGSIHDTFGGQLCVGEGRILALEEIATPQTVAGVWLRELAAAGGLEVVERPLSMAELEASEEAMVVGMPFCIVPLGAPGPVTMRLLADWSRSAGVELAGHTIAPAIRAVR